MRSAFTRLVITVYFAAHVEIIFIISAMPPVRNTNSFDLLRIVFASMVLFTHAYFITGTTDRDLLSRVSHNLYHYPHIAVPGFFIISGFLIIQSLRRSVLVSDYLVRRFVRIYPGLTVMLSITFLLGWVVYSGTIRQYFLNWDIYIYCIKNLLMLHEYVVPKFFEGSPASDIVNVSIWSIPYEVLFYLLLSLFFKIPKRKHLAVAIAIYLFLSVNLILMHYGIGIPDGTFENFTVSNLFRYGSFFFGGVVLGLMNGSPVIHNKILMTLLWILLILVLSFSLPIYFLNILLPVMIVSTGSCKPPKWVSSVLKRTGDPSYGIYIYGFPVQQALYYFFKPGYWQLSFTSLLVLGCIGILSWKFVEKPCLSLLRKERIPKADFDTSSR